MTAQPEVDSASNEIDKMWQYFVKLEKMVEKQRTALATLIESESECSLFFQQLGYLFILLQSLTPDVGSKRKMKLFDIN